MPRPFARSSARSMAFAVASFTALAVTGLAAPTPASAQLTVVESPGDHLLAQAPVDALAGYDSLLRAYATADGGFRYDALRTDTAALAALDAYLAHVEAVDLGALGRSEKLALLINAYNARTLRSVIDLWPVTSVLSESGFFDGRAFVVGGMSVSLNTLENEHIRTMGDPRIHFVVNCASVGCPRLVPEALTATNLERHMQRQAQEFVRSRSTVAPGTIRVSQIFEWFAADFEAGGGVRAFVAAQLDGDARAIALDTAIPITFEPYDWALNARP